MKIQNVKGSMDYLPEEQIIRNKAINILSNTFEAYGYLPVETTTLCYYDLLASKYAGGAEILKEVYKLNDQGERNLALRYDLTVPFSKIIAMNKGLNLPFRRYEIGKVFRDGPVKVGRNREFYQCDVDVCGINGQYVEAELFAMSFTCYNSLGINSYIEWNNRKFLSGIILESGIQEELVSPVILSVDKLAKIGEDGVRKELEGYQIPEYSLDKLFNYFKINIEDLEETFKDSTCELLKEGITEITELNNYLKGLGLNDAIFTPYLARGLEIYTGTVWEVFDKDKNVTCAIGGGGRYDNIITKFISDGESYPAVGMSFGLVPICEILKNKNNDTNKGLYDLYIVPFNKDAEITSLQLANILRKNGVKVIIEMNNKKIKKCFEWANKKNIPYVTVIGEDEIKNKQLSIKNMETGESYKYSFNEIETFVNNIK